MMELDITIGPDGTVKVDIKGAKGKSCLKTAELFQKLVGPQTGKKLTSEYYEPETGISGDLRHT